MKECPKCKNTEFYKTGECCYCVWRGDAGPGKMLKEIIKSQKKRKTEKENRI